MLRKSQKAKFCRFTSLKNSGSLYDKNTQETKFVKFGKMIIGHDWVWFSVAFLVHDTQAWDIYGKLWCKIVLIEEWHIRTSVLQEYVGQIENKNFIFSADINIVFVSLFKRRHHCDPFAKTTSLSEIWGINFARIALIHTECLFGHDSLDDHDFV